jgi:hypothetical protein
MVRAFRVVSQVAVAADSYNLPYGIFLNGSGILLGKFNDVDGCQFVHPAFFLGR